MTDLTSYYRIARDVGIPGRLLLAVADAESGFFPYAQRWGSRTREAEQAMNISDYAWLGSIVASEWPDISFGVSQMIVRWHYVGDRTATLGNVLVVRRTVFDNPAEDLRQMAMRLRWHRAYIIANGPDLTPVNGDIDLAAAVAYNAGHYPPTRPYWLAFSANVRRYREALEQWS